jgi:hypothetical protein
LFASCSELNERLSVILTANPKFAAWVKVFGGERLTALLDQLTCHAHTFELASESYRFRQRMQQGVKDEWPVDSVDNSPLRSELPSLTTDSTTTATGHNHHCNPDTYYLSLPQFPGPAHHRPAACTRSRTTPTSAGSTTAADQGFLNNRGNTTTFRTTFIQDFSENVLVSYTLNKPKKQVT